MQSLQRSQSPSPSPVPRQPPNSPSRFLRSPCHDSDATSRVATGRISRRRRTARRRQRESTEVHPSSSRSPSRSPSPIPEQKVATLRRSLRLQERAGPNKTTTKENREKRAQILHKFKKAKTEKKKAAAVRCRRRTRACTPGPDDDKPKQDAPSILTSNWEAANRGPPALNNPFASKIPPTPRPPYTSLPLCSPSPFAQLPATQAQQKMPPISVPRWPMVSQPFMHPAWQPSTSNGWHMPQNANAQDSPCKVCKVEAGQPGQLTQAYGHGHGHLGVPQTGKTAQAGELKPVVPLDDLLRPVQQPPMKHATHSMGFAASHRGYQGYQGNQYLPANLKKAPAIPTGRYDC